MVKSQSICLFFLFYITVKKWQGLYASNSGKIFAFLLFCYLLHSASLLDTIITSEIIIIIIIIIIITIASFHSYLYKIFTIKLLKKKKAYYNI